jgi:pyruvate kinase
VSRVPVVQKEIIRIANRAGKPVITATQMLESMISSPNPSRADASDIANAVLDGTDALMLSAETAIGTYPTECIHFLKETAKEAEQVYDYQKAMDTWKDSETGSIAEAVSYAAVTSAASIGATAIITTTETGSTSRRIARHRPAAQIIAVSNNSKTLRQLSLVRGVRPVLGKELSTLDDQLNESVLIASSKGFIQSEDLVIVVAGVQKGLASSTNLLNVRLAAKTILSGQGIGNKAVIGSVVIVRSEQAKKRLSSETIAVVGSADLSDGKYYRQAAAIIAESPGLTSEAAIIAREYRIPAICGASLATTTLQNGQKIAINPGDGQVYILDQDT